MQNCFIHTKKDLYLKLGDLLFVYDGALNRFFRFKDTLIVYKIIPISYYVFSKNSYCILKNKKGEIRTPHHTFNHALFELLRYHPCNDNSVLKILKAYIENSAYYINKEKIKNRRYSTYGIKDYCSIYKKCIAA